jgi:transposase
MTFDFTGRRIFIKPGATDLRKASEGLSYQVRDEMKMKPLGGDVFLFCNKSRKLIKALWWDRTGFWLAQKKLEKEKWPWPETAESAQEISTEELQMLLKGIDFWKAHKELYFSDID